MTGLERNADVVEMASYAPLFAHAEGWQWAPDLIWVDNLRSYGTPGYYVQKMFSLNKGTQVVPALSNNAPLTGQDGLYATSCIDKATNEIIVKLVNATDKDIAKEIIVDGAKKLASAGKLIVLKNTLNQVNSFDAPMAVSPVESAIIIKGKKINTVLAPYSFTIIRVKML